MPMKITVMKNRFRKLLALIMALVIFGSAIPMTYAETAACIEGCSENGHAEGCPNAAVKRLFAVWSHGGEPMDSFTIPMDSVSPLVFRYGTDLKNSIPVSFEELSSSNVSLKRSTSMTSEYGEVIQISPAILGTCTVGYTKDPAVSFSLCGILYEGSGPALIAKGSDNNYMSELWVHPDSALTVTFLMATTPYDDSTCQEILPSQLTASEGITLVATGNGNEVSVTATANGSITYGDYSIKLNYTGSSDGSGSDGSESDDQCTDETPHLFTTWTNGTGHMHESNIGIDSSSPLIFYFGTKDNANAIPFSELSRSGIATLQEDTWSTDANGNPIPNAVSLGVSGVGNGTVYYTVGETTYTYPVVGELCNYSCYTAPERTGENYTGSFFPDENNTVTLYLMWGNGQPKPQNVTAVAYDGQNGQSEEEAVTVADFSAVDCGDYILITFPMVDETTVILRWDDSWESIYLQNGTLDGGGSDDQCTEETDHLFTTWTEGTGHMHRSDIGIDSSSPLIFYFGTKDNANAIPFSELSYDGIATLQEDTWSTDANGNPIPNAVSLGINGIGEGTVQYTVGETTYSYPVIGKLRNYSCYTAPERTSENYTGSFFPDEEDTVTLYLMWGDDQPKPQNVTAKAYDGQYGQSEEEAVTVADFSAVDCGDYILITFPMVDETTVILRWDDSWESIYLQNGTLDNSGSDGSSSYTVTVDYEGTPVTVGIGFYMGDFMSLSQGYLGDSFNPDHPRDHRFDIYFAALSNFGDPVNETTAPQDFFNAVSDVTFYVKSFVNTDGSDPSTPNVSFTEVTRDVHAGRNTYMTALQAEQEKFYSAVIAMQFTYQGEVYEITNESHYTYSGDIVLDASSLDTAEKLNAALANSDALLNWFETTHPMQFASFSGDGSNMITLELPAIPYDDVITVCGSRTNGSQREKTFYGIELKGTTQNRMTTTLPGLVCKGFVSGVTGIHFVAQPGKTVTYDGDTFTCGILVDCSGVNTVGDFVDTEVCWINNCTFRGFNYGIRATKDGFAGSTSSCKFLENNYGFYMDCEGGIRGGNTSYTQNTFINNGCAVTIKGLPQETTAYRIRFTDSVFTHNSWDFRVLVRARFYFYRNWYGHYPLMPFSDEIDYDTLTPESRSALIDDNSDVATVVSNPRRMALDSLDLGIDNALGLHSMILNSEAADLLVSGLALEALTGTADIPVLGENEEEIGIWTFGGE